MIVQARKMSGAEVLPLVEGGKGVSATNGVSAGAWARAGGIGTFSGVNADSFSPNGELIPQTYYGRTRKDRHEELIAHGIRGAIHQARVAWETAGGNGRIHMNVLWEMGGAEQVLLGALQGAKGLIHGVTCGAGMPYRLAEIAASFGVYYYPIVSSARAFRALWKRSYHGYSEWLGGVVYEDPWLAGGHNGLSNSENPVEPQSPRGRVADLRKTMNEVGLSDVPIVMAGGVWRLDEWEDWIDDPDLAPVAFQFGTRPLLTQESPIPDVWKKKLPTLMPGDVLLQRFSPTGFYSSAVRNTFLDGLEARSQRQIGYSLAPEGDQVAELVVGTRGRKIFVTSDNKTRAEQWIASGYTEGLRTPDSTMVFTTPQEARQIHKDQVGCMGCLSQCRFSNWSQGESGSTGRKPDPRSFCIQKTLQAIAHGDPPEDHLMFAGHNAYRFGQDDWYANGFVPTVKQLVERIASGQ